MKIAKYIFLLLLLIATSFSVFIFTQPGEYKLQKSITINSEKEEIFEHIYDFKNWENWFTIKNGKISNPSFGEQAYIKWKNQEKITNKNVSNSDSLEQKYILKNTELKSKWFFIQNDKKTTITWELIGVKTFSEKFLTLIGKNNDTELEDHLYTNLNNFKEYWENKYDIFQIKYGEIITYNESSYLIKKDSCKLSQFQENSLKTLKKLKNFIVENELTVNGTPFISYQKKAIKKDSIFYKINYPINEEIITSPSSDIIALKKESSTYYKITLKGNLKYRPDAWKKGEDFIINQKEEYRLNISEEFLENIPNEISISGKNTTDIYIPISVKNITTGKTRPMQIIKKDSTN